MTRSLREAPGSKRMLEVGPGTGSFTSRILASMRAGDELHIVERNPVFCRRLESQVLRPFRAAHPGMALHLQCGAVESVPIEGRFDYIICGLPFNNFSSPLVRAIFKRMLRLLVEGGELAYFEYAGLRWIRGPLAGRHGRRRLKRLAATGRVLRRRHAGRRELILVNVPPAYAVRLVR